MLGIPEAYTPKTSCCVLWRCYTTEGINDRIDVGIPKVALNKVGTSAPRRVYSAMAISNCAVSLA